MFCHKCGRRFLEYHNFCSYCGSELKEEKGNYPEEPDKIIAHSNNLTTNSEKYRNITKLEQEFEEKYQEFIKVDDDPESGEYQRLKAELFRIEEEIDSILWG